MFMFTLLLTALVGQSPPIGLHPENPHYFTFRARPTILITSGEHYGAVLNQDFEFLPYLDELKRRGFNQTRLFSGTYREVPGSFKIQANTLAPLPGRFVGPYARSDKPGARDGGNLFDLDRWDAAYFDRLTRFVQAASDRGIVVEFVLFCPFYDESLWTVNAWHPANNINKTPTVKREEVYTLKHEPYLKRQLAFVREVVAKLNRFDNVYFEICNEPYFGGVAIDWQHRVADTIVGVESGLPNRHLIAQNIANGKAKIERPHPNVGLFNFHYATPPTTVGMNYDLNKAIGDDETGFKGTADRVYRIEAWDFLLAGGALFSHLDYSFTTDHEAGTAPVKEPTPGGGGPEFRAQIAYLVSFMNGLPFLKMRPSHAGEVVVVGPKKSSLQALIEPGRTVAAYLHGEAGPVVLEIALPDGEYEVTWHSPTNKKIIKSSRAAASHGKLRVELPAAEREEDVALIVRLATEA